jgi:hypothetical protein
MYDIYNPPPAPVPWSPPKPERLVFTWGDLLCLVLLFTMLLALSIFAWPAEPTVALLIVVGGALVIFESWFTALGFLHRFKPLGLRARWTIFLAALIPWLIGLGIAAALMLGLFWIADVLT